MTMHITERLSAYLDDELSVTERAAADEHLRACAECAATLEELRHVVALAARAPDADTPPERDLWRGIDARILGSHVTAMPSIPAAPRRGVTLSTWQLAAAAALLMAVSGATAWFVRGGLPVAPAPAAVNGTVEAELEPTPEPDAVRLANFADAAYDAAVADLERTLTERRNDLNPRTVEILERNLRLIDAAIAQSRQALEQDPGNMYLNRHLVESRRRKLDLLRRAASITEGD